MKIWIECIFRDRQYWKQHQVVRIWEEKRIEQNGSLKPPNLILISSAKKLIYDIKERILAADLYRYDKSNIK